MRKLFWLLLIVGLIGSFMTNPNEKDFKEFIRISKAKETPTKALLEALIEKDIIKKKGTYFYNGEDLLGSSTDEVVSYLTDIKNQAVKLALQGKLKPKKTKSE